MQVMREFYCMTTHKTPLKIVGARNTSAEIPDLADIYSMGYKALTDLPKKYQPFLKSLVVRVENFPNANTLQNLQLSDRYDLLGLYKGTPLPQKTLNNTTNVPDIIYLYRCPLIRYARENREPVDVLVNHIMIHEIGHHFGFTDEEMDLFRL
jgi:predicted Zn-dependent protease with MMP-like domain